MNEVDGRVWAVSEFSEFLMCCGREFQIDGPARTRTAKLHWLVLVMGVRRLESAGGGEGQWVRRRLGYCGLWKWWGGGGALCRGCDWVTRKLNSECFMVGGWGRTLWPSMRRETSWAEGRTAGVVYPHSASGELSLKEQSAVFFLFRTFF